MHWQRCFLSFQGQNIHNRIPCKHNYHHLSDIFYILHTFICSQNCYFDYTSFWIIVKNLQKWMIETALVLKKPNILSWKMLFQLLATSLGNLTSNTFQDYFHAVIWIFECIIRSFINSILIVNSSICINIYIIYQYINIFQLTCWNLLNTSSHSMS